MTRITATLAAHRAIARLRSSLGERLMFVLSSGGCAQSTPRCLPEGEFLRGENDIQLGFIDGCPFYIDARLDEAWGQARLMLDVVEGEPDDLSLPAGRGMHFVTRSSNCPGHVQAPDQRPIADAPPRDALSRLPR